MPILKRKQLNRTIGELGEEAVVTELSRRGCRILLRNYCCPHGEVDIIAEDRGVIAFVEVKTRSPRALAHPASAVDAEKRRRIRKAAGYFMAGFRQPSPIRFDVACVWVDSADRVERIEVEINAFE